MGGPFCRVPVFETGYKSFCQAIKNKYLKDRKSAYGHIREDENVRVHSLTPWGSSSESNVVEQRYNEKNSMWNFFVRRLGKDPMRWSIPACVGLGVFTLALFIGSLRFFPTLYLPKDPLVYLARVYTGKPNRVLDRDGRLVAELFTTKTGHLNSHEIPESMEKIIIFVEDKDFYEHGGIHWTSVLRASLYNVLSFRYVQGGSTITQQLARLLLLEKQKTLSRKVREAALAYFLERNFSKEEILTAYLNLVYLGHGAYGVEHAARFYFQKDLGQLNFTQQLMLACLPSSPENYSPLRNPENLEVKMKLVYKRMLKEKFPVGVMTEKEWKVSLYNISRSPLENVHSNRIDHAPYVTEYIRQKLASILGKEYMYNAGLTIKTSLDLRLQRMSSQESQTFMSEHGHSFATVNLNKANSNAKHVKKKLLRIELEKVLPVGLMGAYVYKRPKPRLQTSSIGIENRTGNILFLQGGRQFGANNQFNRAIHMYRQTGSAIKPILYALALEQGVIRTNTLLDDKPIFEKQTKLSQSGKGYWSPKNYSGVYEGPISVRRALAYSQNLPAIHVAQLLGMKRIEQGFARFFFPDKESIIRRFRADNTVALGSLEASPLEMALAYSAFGNNGVIRRPKLILAIYNAGGQAIYQAADNDEFQVKFEADRKVLNGDTAEIMVDLLRDCARRSGILVKIRNAIGNFAGKTGTTDQYRDSWFVGLTPKVTAAVWVGFDDPSFAVQGGTGARLAAPLWGRIMRYSPAGAQTFSFSPRARSVQICPPTGNRYSTHCPAKPQRELFRSEDRLDYLDRRLMSSPEAIPLNANSDF